MTLILVGLVITYRPRLRAVLSVVAMAVLLPISVVVALLVLGPPSL